MAQITYIEFDGSSHTVEVEAGQSIMQGAVNNGIPGIIAECGGNCACGTCRVYVHESWWSKVGPPAEFEEATMEIREDGSPNKRLGCQIIVNEELDGLVVTMPENQF